jgi:hypothetical protein
MDFICRADDRSPLGRNFWQFSLGHHHSPSPVAKHLHPQITNGRHKTESQMVLPRHLASSAILTIVHSFFEISIGGKKEGRVIFELFADVVPRTADKYPPASAQARLTTKFPGVVYGGEGCREEWESSDVQGVWFSSNYQEIHDSRYNVFLWLPLTDPRWGFHSWKWNR